MHLGQPWGVKLPETPLLAAGSFIGAYYEIHDISDREICAAYLCSAHTNRQPSRLKSSLPKS